MAGIHASRLLICDDEAAFGRFVKNVADELGYVVCVTVIRRELEQGWSAKAIFQRHADKLTAISYPQFLRYIHQLKSGAAPGEANKTVYAPASGRFVNPAAPQPDPRAAGRSPAPREPAASETTASSKTTRHTAGNHGLAAAACLEPSAEQRRPDMVKMEASNGRREE